MSDRTEQLRAAIAARLERVRGNLTETEFAQLVADIAMIAERLEQIEERAIGRKTPIPGTLATFKEPEVRN